MNKLKANARRENVIYKLEGGSRIPKKCNKGCTVYRFNKQDQLPILRKTFKILSSRAFPMAQELCAACRTITLSMFLNGFQHPLDYNQILVSQNCCRLCALMLTAYDTQTCVTYPKRECDKIHRGRLTWSTKRLLDSDLRWGMFKLDYYHFGTDFQVCTLEGIVNFLPICGRAPWNKNADADAE